MKKYAAFTLIELLVVISIIAILLAILMPSLRSAREAAQTVLCQSNLKSLGMGVLYYSNDHEDRLPPGFSYPGAPNSNEWYFWWAAFLTDKYPQYAGKHNYLQADWGEEKSGNLFRCPSSGVSNKKNYFSYAMPAGLSTLEFAGRDRTINGLEQPAATGLLLCSWPLVPVTDWWLQAPHPQAGLISDATNRRSLYHKGDVDNFVFLDGHVESLKEGQETEPKYVMYFRMDGTPE